MDAQPIVRASERILTLAKRAIVSDDRDTRRNSILGVFGAMATDAGMLALSIGTPNWGGVVMAAYDLHTAACNADERRSGTFTHLGSETALLSSLHSFAAVLGFCLAKADAPATIDAEGHGMQEAAE